MAEPLVHLFDSHVYIFRAWVTLPDMPAPDGTHTGAAYGFANTLLRYLNDEKPEYAACCFDYSMFSFRNKVFPAYKSSRGDEVPPDLAPQFDLAKDASWGLGLGAFEQVDFEADDVIGTLVDQLLKQGARVRVISSDKDLAQLVTEDGTVSLYDLQRETHMDADGVREKFGVDPAQIPDYLALVGDAVDDLPGVPGYGKKSAAIALGAFGSLEGIPDDPEEWAGVEIRGAKRLAANMAEHREQALKIRELATVVRSVPGIEASLADVTWHGADSERFPTLCDRLGWGRIATRAEKWA